VVVEEINKFCPHIQEGIDSQLSDWDKVVARFPIAGKCPSTAEMKEVLGAFICS